MERSSECAAVMDQHLSAPWPESLERGDEIGGLDLAMVDADISGWAMRAGSLTHDDRRALGDTCESLEDVLPLLPVEARAYFERLIQLGQMTLATRRASVE